MNCSVSYAKCSVYFLNRKKSSGSGIIFKSVSNLVGVLLEVVLPPQSFIAPNNSAPLIVVR